MRDGFIKVAASTPEIRVADVDHNKKLICEGVDQAWNIAQQGQNNVENKRPAETFPQQYSQRRQNDSKNDSPETHTHSLQAKN